MYILVLYNRKSMGQRSKNRDRGSGGTERDTNRVREWGRDREIYKQR